MISKEKVGVEHSFTRILSPKGISEHQTLGQEILQTCFIFENFPGMIQLECYNIGYQNKDDFNP
jgi:hypothetical protein